MKLSEKTISVLKNFAAINNSISIEAGNRLKTISPTKDIIAVAEIDQEFEADFSVFELPKLLGVLSLFKDPELVFSEGFLTVKEGKNTTRFVFCDPSIVTKPPAKDILLPSVAVTVTIPQETLASVLKASSLMSLPHITLRGDGSKVSIVTHDTSNSSSNEYSFEVGDTTETFNVDIKSEKFKFVPDDYLVEVSPKLLSTFTGKTGIKYWVACEGTSKFA
jgi:hypothetical protein